MRAPTVSTKGIAFLLGSLVVAAVVVAPLVIQSEVGRGNGISKSEAIRVAWQFTGDGAVAVQSVELKNNFQAPFNVQVHRWAWFITFRGQWHLLCSGHVTDRSCDPTSDWVAIDYYSGQWIASEFSFPAGG